MKKIILLIFSYTFATPNCTTEPDDAVKNIFNFCFTDDFVPQVPLTNWGYGKHGVTCDNIAAGALYANSENEEFIDEINGFVNRSKGRDEASFNLSGTQHILNDVYNKANTIEEYYTEKYTVGFNPLLGINHPDLHKIKLPKSRCLIACHLNITITILFAFVCILRNRKTLFGIVRLNFTKKMIQPIENFK